MLDVKVSRPSYDSPLRYPGGKSSLAGFFDRVIAATHTTPPCFIEPYGGGAGAAVSLLLSGRVASVIVNDLDPAVHAFWRSVVDDSARFIEAIRTVPLTLDEWHKQRASYRAASTAPSDPFELGFAFFYLNRTNRSGVLNAGVIGGQSQAGTYRIGARFNREGLARRVEALANVRQKITISATDGRAVVEEHASAPNSFFYVDPPYVKAGGTLYLNAFTELDHTLLATCLSRHASASWVLTYDDAPLIRELYSAREVSEFELNYSARNTGKATELMVLSDTVADALRSPST